MRKAKHSKFKNTGILFELLTRQVTADILAGKDESAAKDLLFKYFAEHKELGKEWQLYNFLLNEKAKDELQSQKYINVILKQRKKLDSKKLTEQKYSLIKEIKQNYPIDDLLKSSIKNYKIHASIYKVFENHISNSIKFDVKEIIQSTNTITENLYGKKSAVNESEDELINFYRQQNEEVRLLSYKLLVESLNEKYKDLDNNQKRLLKEYINNISNTNSLNEFVQKEIGNIKETLSNLLNSISDNVIKIKINEVVKQIDTINCEKSVKDNQIIVLLLSYELIKELQNKIQ
jgi:hypothetical protein